MLLLLHLHVISNDSVHMPALSNSPCSLSLSLSLSLYIYIYYMLDRSYNYTAHYINA